MVKKNSFNSKEYLLQRETTFLHAKKEFQFLVDEGYNIISENFSKSLDFKQGWHIEYKSDTNRILVCYVEVTLEVIFYRNDISIDYFVLDKSIFNKKSGFSGQMFTLEKLNVAVSKIAADIKSNYRNVIRNDEFMWKKVEKLYYEHKRQMKEESKRITLEAANNSARKKADIEFKNKNYRRVVELLTPLKEYLSKSYLAKLEFAKNHNKQRIIKLLFTRWLK